MERVLIPGTQLHCSRVALGTWSIGGSDWQDSDDRDSLRAIRTALERGINTIDTAPIYGHGHAERLIGAAMAEYGQRDTVIIASKFGLDWSRGGIARDSSPPCIRREIEDSLRRLRTDYIDLYQEHWPDDRNLEASAAELERLREEGKIRAIGVSNFSPQQMESFRRGAPIHTNQPPYNIFEREIESEQLPYCRAHNIAVLVYSPLARGLLSGKMKLDSQFASHDIRNADPKFQPLRYGQYLEAVTLLDRLAQERYGKHVIHLAARWLFDQPGVCVVLWGARRPEQLQVIDDIFGWHLDRIGFEQIDHIVRQCVKDPVGPEFLAPPPVIAA